MMKSQISKKNGVNKQGTTILHLENEPIPTETYAIWTKRINNKNNHRLLHLPKIGVLKGTDCHGYKKSKQGQFIQD